MRETIYRLPPCSAMNVKAMETWLGDMAEQGWYLCDDGITFGVAEFRKEEPGKLHYRMDIKRAGWVRKKSGRLNDEEQKKSHIENGWEYIADYGDFHIYRSETLTDLYMDHAQLLEEFQRKKLNAWFDMLWALIVILLLPILDLDGHAMMLTAQMGLSLVVFSLLMILLYYVGHIRKARMWARYQEAIRNDEGYEYEYPVPIHPRRYYGKKVIQGLLVAIWVGLLIHRLVVDSDLEMPIAEWNEELPFPTIADMAPDGDYEIDDSMGIANTVRHVSTWLAPYVYEWDEIARAENGNGQVVNGALYIDYYEMRYEWLAEWMMKEFRWTSRKHGEVNVNLDLQALGVDYAEVYIGEIHMPTVIIQNENKVIKAEFNSHGPGNHFKLEDWILQLAESMK